MIKTRLFRYIFKKLNIIPKTMLWQSKNSSGPSEIYGRFP